MASVDATAVPGISGPMAASATGTCTGARPDICVRPGTAADVDWATPLAFAAAVGPYMRLAGSRAAAERAIRRAWLAGGNSLSHELALVAEVDGHPAGLLIAFPARLRYRLHLRLLLSSLHDLPLQRIPMLALAGPLLVAMTPRPPRAALYVGSLAVSAPFRRRGVAFALGREAEARARAARFERVVAHTGTRHLVARRALELYGLRTRKCRRRGFVLYELALD